MRIRPIIISVALALTVSVANSVIGGPAPVDGSNCKNYHGATCEFTTAGLTWHVYCCYMNTSTARCDQVFYRSVACQSDGGDPIVAGHEFRTLQQGNTATCPNQASPAYFQCAPVTITP
ncbi:MAG: hypothetical protein QOJ65_1531 [Fimbriimonadaceae bacterium]|jgi:hypothetical protein|nr:hypothetical protein [Fimbriimonadaceae bacterium]